MDTGERLAAYLSGDLDPGERTALEAELARDADLRARRDRIRAADAALTDLPDVELPEGSSARLHERLARELDAVLGDELTARRARRTVPRWLPAVGAAAAVALVVAGGIGVTGGLGGGDQAAETSDTRATTEAGGQAEADMAESLDTTEAAAAGPLVVALDRTVGSDDLQALTADPDVQATMASDAVQSDPAAAAEDFAAALGASPQELEGLDDERAAGTSTARAVPPVAIRGEVSEQDREAIATCLPTLFQDAAHPVVPLYAELATDEDGDPVIVYAALSPDADGQYQRVEAWMLDRDTCEPRLFVQSGAQPAERNAP